MKSIVVSSPMALMRALCHIRKATPALIDQAMDMPRLTAGRASCSASNPLPGSASCSKWHSKRPAGMPGRCGRPCSNRLKSRAIRTRRVLEKERRRAGRDATWESGSPNETKAVSRPRDNGKAIDSKWRTLVGSIPQSGPAGVHIQPIRLNARMVPTAAAATPTPTPIRTFRIVWLGFSDFAGLTDRT